MANLVIDINNEPLYSLLEKVIDDFWFTIYEQSGLDKTFSAYHSELIFQSQFQPRTVSLGFYSNIEIAISQSLVILGEQGITADILRSSDRPYQGFVQIKQHLRECPVGVEEFTQ